MFINWDGFNDVEEFKTGPHASGIKEYILAIGKQVFCCCHQVKNYFFTLR